MDYAAVSTKSLIRCGKNTYPQGFQLGVIHPLRDTKNPEFQGICDLSHRYPVRGTEDPVFSMTLNWTKHENNVFV